MYELTANLKLKQSQVIDKSSFSAEAVSFRKVIKSDQQLLLLDDLAGVRSLSISGGLNALTPDPRLLYEQFGCYEMVADSEKAFLLACAPSRSTSFLMKVLKSTLYSSPTYEPFETIFLPEKIYSVDMRGEVLLSQVYNGAKLYWSS